MGIYGRPENLKKKAKLEDVKGCYRKLNISSCVILTLQKQEHLNICTILEVLQLKRACKSSQRWRGFADKNDRGEL